MKKKLQLLSARDKAVIRLEEASRILLEKAGNDEGLYQNSRYVKMASKRAYTAALLIVDEYLSTHQNKHFSKPTDLDDYVFQLKQCNKELMILLVDVHAKIYILGSIHGSKSLRNMRIGLKNISQMLNLI